MTRLLARTLGTLAAIALLLACASASEARTMRLVFSDEFNGGALDTSKWISTVEWWGGIGCLDPQSPTVSGGVLHLAAKAGQPSCPTGYTGQNVQTGQYGSPRPFAFTYGRVEARVKIAHGQGLWPAVWLVTDGSDQGSEIDLAEWEGHATNETWMTVHYPQSTGGGYSQGYYPGTDFGDGFHTIRVDWKRGLVVWSIDGIERQRVSDSRVPATPLYVVLDHWVTDAWPGPPNDQSVFPADFQVDYLRVWQ